MSSHEKTLVPLESWCYSSPELLRSGFPIDIGLFAEALIYYDSVLVSVGGQSQFAAFLKWFEQQAHLDDFLALVKDGVIQLHEYSFHTIAAGLASSNAAEPVKNFSLINMQDPIQALPNSFEQRYLYHPEIEAVLPTRARLRRKFYSGLSENVVEEKADDFAGAIENAKEDFEDAGKMARVVQVFVDEIYRTNGVGPAPEIQASVKTGPDGQSKTITWNTDFSQLSEMAGTRLNFGNHTPMTALGHSNRFILSAANLNCDLFLPKPMSFLTGDKLFESSLRHTETSSIIEELKNRVEFPDIRDLVNSGNLQLADILRIRKKAQRFRDWLQSESDRDRDAIIAYHNEVARESGFTKGARKSISLFGVISSGAVGALVGGAVGGPMGGALGAAAGSGVGYVADIASKLGADWRPVIFGDWQRDQIEKILNDREQDA